MIRLFVAVFLVFTACAGQSAAQGPMKKPRRPETVWRGMKWEHPLPAVAAKIFDDFEKDIEKNQEKFETWNGKAVDDTIRLLEAEAVKMTNEGRLNDALATKRSIEALPEILGRLTAKEGENGPKMKTVKLTQMQPSHQIAEQDWFTVNSIPLHKDFQQASVKIENKPCNEYLFAHAPSVLVYDLPPGTRRFIAAGLCPTGIPPNDDAKLKGHWAHVVRVDGRLVFNSGEIGTKAVPIVVNIPAGARKISLEVDPLGSPGWDAAVWAYPVLEVEER